MAYLIRTIDFTATGRELIREREFEGEILTIGRASENALPLPDLAVEQEHARVSPGPGGQLQVEALGTLGFTHDGRSTDSATFNPREGGELGFGSYRLEFSQEGDGPITVTQRQVEEDEGGNDAIAGFALATALPSKRVMSWVAVVVILLAFLAVPIFTHLTRERVEPDYGEPGKVAFDASWSTGDLSLAHHGLEDNCEACHVAPFEAVKDETCLTCHQDLAEHAQMDRQDIGRAPFSIGEDFQWMVAAGFGKEGPGGCVSCHVEHEGAVRMEPPVQAFCADCHDGMDARLTDTDLGNAADFGDDHPQFRPTVWARPGDLSPVRVSLDGEAREFSGLLFPHDIHIDPEGGAARMGASLGASKGYGDVLICADCHTPTRDGTGFEPISMEDSCESCHSLVYDKVGPIFRTLQHGNVEQMLADLQASDRKPHQPVITGRNRPGEFGRGGIYYQNFGRPNRSLVAINRAMERDGVCGACHIPAASGNMPGVTPVNLPDRFILHAIFDHDAHKQEDCTTCHEAESSKTSRDLLMPPIAICRDCHLGEDAREADVPSTCAMCHTYHPKDGLPADHPQTMPEQVAAISRKPG